MRNVDCIIYVLHSQFFFFKNNLGLWGYVSRLQIRKQRVAVNVEYVECGDYWVQSEKSFSLNNLHEEFNVDSNVFVSLSSTIVGELQNRQQRRRSKSVTNFQKQFLCNLDTKRMKEHSIGNKSPEESIAIDHREETLIGTLLELNWRYKQASLCSPRLQLLYFQNKKKPNTTNSLELHL